MSTEDIFEELFKEQLKLMKKWMEAMQKQWEETLKMLNQMFNPEELEKLAKEGKANAFYDAQYLQVTISPDGKPIVKYRRWSNRPFGEQTENYEYEEEAKFMETSRKV
jgi:hypothetical protein